MDYLFKNISSKILSWLAFRGNANMNPDKASWREIYILLRRTLGGYLFCLKHCWASLTQTSSKVLIVVPTQKTIGLNDSEKLSLLQLGKIFGDKYPIEILTSKANTKGEIEDLLPHANFRFLPAENFASVLAYSKLLTQSSFYKSYLNYKFVLIYQTDALVFKDELSYWCDQNNDYIGAPWLDISKTPVEAVEKASVRNFPSVEWSKEPRVGNGGLSLRKVRKLYNVLTRYEKNQVTWDFENEDSFWCFFAPMYYPPFKIPSAKIAVQFSIETLPSLAFKMNAEQLPFGCHAWEKHEPEFWRPFVAKCHEKIER